MAASGISLTAIAPNDRPSVSSPQAAYVHIPFCRRRCYYCDFPISVVGDRPPIARPQTETGGHGSGAIARYVDTLCTEITATPAGEQRLTTVFFGGGTPSLLSVEQLERILTALDQTFGIAQGAEISMEMDPGTFTRAQLLGYVAQGVNRISLGVQAFQAELLAACGRTHTPADIEMAIALIQTAGVENYSLDLISGLPHQTLDHWRESLESALRLNPAHLSVYDLTVEPMTAFSRWYRPGTRPLPSDDTTADMYRLAQSTLTRVGYEHYEISNYARPGYQCLHNRTYWENRPYYGFGLGATSFVGGHRLSRPRTQEGYRQWVEEQLVAHAPSPTAEWAPAAAVEVTDPNEALLDTLMLGLRLAEGVEVQVLTKQFGDRATGTVLAVLAQFSQRGWIEWVGPDGPLKFPLDISQSAVERAIQRVCLADPEGFLMSNVILSTLFAAFSD